VRCRHRASVRPRGATPRAPRRRPRRRRAAHRRRRPWCGRPSPTWAPPGRALGGDESLVGVGVAASEHRCEVLPLHRTSQSGAVRCDRANGPAPRRRPRSTAPGHPAPGRPIRDGRGLRGWLEVADDRVHDAGVSARPPPSGVTVNFTETANGRSNRFPGGEPVNVCAPDLPFGPMSVDRDGRVFRGAGTASEAHRPRACGDRGAFGVRMGRPLCWMRSRRALAGGDASTGAGRRRRSCSRWLSRSRSWAVRSTRAPARAGVG
jgi:hypothetical protein